VPLVGLVCMLMVDSFGRSESKALAG
jgi:hypothetical protein